MDTQIIWFRENWYEEVLRQLKIALAKCYAIAFENRSTVLEASITPQLQNFVRKLVSTFGHGESEVRMIYFKCCAWYLLRAVLFVYSC